MNSEELSKAQELVTQANKERAEKCGEQIARILNEYGCRMDPEFWIVGVEIKSRVRISVREVHTHGGNDGGGGNG